MAVVATVTITFIIVGDINTLAPIVTMPFLLTYACIDYSYFALAQTFDIQNKREERFRIQAQSPSYESRRYGSTSDHDNDLDHLFPDRTRHKSLSVCSKSQKITKRIYELICYKLQAPIHSNTPQHVPLTSNLPTSDTNNSIDSTDPDRVIFRGGATTNSTNITDNGTATGGGNEEPNTAEDEPIAPIRPPIHSKTKNWYSSYCNRWASLIGVS